MVDNPPWTARPARDTGIAGRAVAAIPAFRNDRRLQFGENDEKFIAGVPLKLKAKGTSFAFESPEATYE
jgi:hypothetical protein